MRTLQAYKTVPKYHMMLSLSKYERPTPFEKADVRPDTAIVLPLPQELQDISTVSINQTDQGLLGDVLNIVDRAVDGDVGTALTARTTGRAGMAVAGAAIGRAAPRLATAAAGRSGDLATAVSQGLGYIANPNPVAMFQGPSLRDWSYTWTLQPTNKDESKQIASLVQTLKKASLPETAFEDQSAFLKYPRLVQCNYFPWDEGSSDNKWGWTSKSIIRHKRAFMSNVTVNYNPGSHPSFFEGTNLPTFTQITITFQEVEYLLSNDWGGDNGVFGADFEDFRNDLTNNISELTSNVTDEAQEFLSGLGDIF